MAKRRTALKQKKSWPFIVGVERLIKPKNVGSLSFFNSFLKYLPIKLQKSLFANSVKDFPYMGFVVEPYSLFTFHKIKDLKLAKSYLPKGFELAKTKVYNDDEPDYYVIFSCFNAHTSAFWGTRIEMYVIAKNTTDGRLSWIMIEVDSNTLSYYPKTGITEPSSNEVVMTTTFDGELLIDVKNQNKQQAFRASCDITRGVFKNLDQPLWLVGNLSIAYGKPLIDGEESEPFSLKFNPSELARGLALDPKLLSIEIKQWYRQMYEVQPSKVVCFPYAQHYVSDSYGSILPIKNKKELLKSVKKFGDLSKYKGFNLDRILKLAGFIALFNFLLVVVLVLIAVFK